MYYSNWAEPTNYSSRQFFKKYGQAVEYQYKFTFLNFNRSIRDAVRSLMSYSEGRIGAMWGLNLEDPLFLESIFFRILLSDGRYLQVEVLLKETTLYRLIENALIVGCCQNFDELLFGKLQYIWKTLLLMELKNPKNEVPSDDISAIKEWVRLS